MGIPDLLVRIGLVGVLLAGVAIGPVLASGPSAGVTSASGPSAGVTSASRPSAGVTSASGPSAACSDVAFSSSPCWVVPSTQRVTPQHCACSSVITSASYVVWGEGANKQIGGRHPLTLTFRAFTHGVSV